MENFSIKKQSTQVNNYFLQHDNKPRKEIKKALNAAEMELQKLGKSEKEQSESLKARIGLLYVRLGDSYRDEASFSKACNAYQAASPYMLAVTEAKLSALPPSTTSIADTPIFPTEWRARLVSMRASIARALKHTPYERQATEYFFPKSKSLPPLCTESGEVVGEVHEVRDTPSLVVSLQALQTASADVQKPFLCLVEALIDQFAKIFPTFEHVQELVLLAKIPVTDVYKRIINQMVRKLDPDREPLLNETVAQGLAVMLKQASDALELDKHPGFFMDVLRVLQKRLDAVHLESNATQLLPLLQAVSTLLDAMVWHKVAGLNRQSVQEPLKAKLDKIAQHADSTVSYYARYAGIALAYLAADESLKLSIARHLGEASIGTGLAVSAFIKVDPSKFVSAYKHFANALNISVPFAWYQGLLYLDDLLSRHAWQEFEKFALESKLAKDVGFLQGLCLRLEQIASTQSDEDIQQAAISFLKSLVPAQAGQDKLVKQSAQAALKRLGELCTDMSATQLQPSAGNGAPLPPIWDPIWYAPFNSILLKSVQQENKRRARLESMAMQFPAFTQHVQQGQARVIHTLQVNHQELIDKLAASNLSASQPLDQPLTLLGDTITALQAAYATSLATFRDIRDALALYIPLQGKESAHSSTSADLAQDVKRFVAQEITATMPRVMLIQGQAGSGKSTFNRYISRQMWGEYMASSRSANDRFPIFIALSELEQPHRGAIPQFLKRYGFNEAQIQWLKENQRLLFIFDGYDEIKDRHQLFYKNNQLEEWQHAQFIVTSRPEYLGSNYVKYFSPTGEPQLLMQRWLAPFSPAAQRDYIQRYVTYQNGVGQPKVSWTVSQYEQALNKFTSLQETLHRPIILRMVLEVLPSLVMQPDALAKLDLTLGSLYEAFMQQWWERSHDRLAAIQSAVQLTGGEAEAYRNMCEAGFTKAGLAFSQEYAFMLLFKAQADFKQKAQAFECAHPQTYQALTGQQEKWRLLRLSAPFRLQVGQTSQFIHPSFQDYLVARLIGGPDAEFSDPLSSAPFNQINLASEPVVLDFLVEWAKQNEAFSGHLHAWIEASKHDQEVSQGAANAITVLVRAGVSFNGADLKGIKIAGANLSYGMFDLAQLQNSDLTNVTLRAVWLRNADLSGAQMEGVQFGEWPFLQENSVICSCAYSPDGKWLAVGLYKSGEIGLYQTSNWQSIHTLRGHTDSVYTMSFSGDSSRIVSGSKDKTIRIWNIQTGEALLVIHGCTHEVVSVAFSKDSRRIAFSGDEDGTAGIYDAHTGEIFQILYGHTERIESIAFSEDGSRIVSGSKDKTIGIWDIQTGEVLQVLYGHTHEVVSVAFSRDGRRIISSGDEDGTARIWDTETGELLKTLHGHTQRIRRVAFSEDGNQIVSGGQDKSIRIWDAQTGKVLQTLHGHNYEVVSVVFSKDGSQVISLGRNEKEIRIWDIQTGKVLQTFHDHTKRIDGVAFSEDGSQVISNSEEEKISIWDAQTGRGLQTLVAPNAKASGVVLSKDGSRTFSFGADDRGGILKMWDAQTGQTLEIEHDHKAGISSLTSSKNSLFALRNDSAPLTDLWWGISGDMDGQMRAWNLQTGGLLWTTHMHIRDVNCISISKNGLWVVSGGDDGRVRVWSARTGDPFWSSRGCFYITSNTVPLPDGGEFVLFPKEDTERVEKVQMYDPEKVPGHTSFVYDVAFSNDSKLIVSASDDKTVRIWDLRGFGKPLRTLYGHTDTVCHVTFSNDDKRVISCSVDKTVRIWDAHTGRCLAVIEGFNSIVTAIAWQAMPEEREYALLTGEGDSTLRLWHITETNNGQMHTSLRWTSHQAVLMVKGTNLRGVQGLNEMNARLLKQRGAAGLRQTECLIL